MEGKKINTEGLPPWEMFDDGLINTSGLANAKMMIYTFVEAAIAHNDRILIEQQFPAPSPDPQLPPPPTKQEVNLLLSGAFNLGGIRRWWQRPRKTLDMKTPHEVWETDPQRVWDVARELVTGILKEERKDG